MSAHNEQPLARPEFNALKPLAYSQSSPTIRAASELGAHGDFGRSAFTVAILSPTMPEA